MKNVTSAPDVRIIMAPVGVHADEQLSLHGTNTVANAVGTSPRRQRTGATPGRAGRRKCTQTPFNPGFTLLAMPTELLDEIASYLPPDSGATRALTLAHPELRRQFRDRVRSDGLQVQAQRSPDPGETIDSCVKLIEQARLLPDPERCKVLCAVARDACTHLRPGDGAPLPLLEELLSGMRDMEEPMHRYAVMHAFGDMVADAAFKWNIKESYDPALQGRKADELANARVDTATKNPFPEIFLAKFFTDFQAESKAFVREHAESIAAACNLERPVRLAFLINSAKHPSFSPPFTAAMVQAETLGMFSRSAYLVLPFQDRPCAWQALHQRSAGGEPAERLAVLLALSDALIDLVSSQDRIDAFNAVRESAGQLGPEQKARLLNKLATILPELDAGDQSLAVRQALQRAAASLPQTEQCECLALMASSLGVLEDDVQVSAFESMLAPVEHATSGAAGKLIAAMAGAIIDLPSEECSAMFATLLALAGELENTEQPACHVALADGLGPFSGFPWLEDSLIALRDAASRRSRETRGMVTVALACQLEKFKSMSTRAAVLDEALDYIRSLPIDQRVPLFSKVIGAPFRRVLYVDQRAALNGMLDLLNRMHWDDGVALVAELIHELEKSNCNSCEKAMHFESLKRPFVQMRPKDYVILCEPAMRLAASLIYPVNKQCVSSILEIVRTLPKSHADAAMHAASNGLMTVIDRFVESKEPMTRAQQQKRLSDLLLLAPALPEAMQIIAVRKLDKLISDLPFLEFVDAWNKLLAYFDRCPPGLQQRIYAR